MTKTQEKILDYAFAGIAITGYTKFERARMYGPGRVRGINQNTLMSLEMQGCLVCMECDDGVSQWLQWFPGFSVEPIENNWDNWAA